MVAEGRGGGGRKGKDDVVDFIFVIFVSKGRCRLCESLRDNLVQPYSFFFRRLGLHRRNQSERGRGLFLLNTFSLRKRGFGGRGLKLTVLERTLFGSSGQGGARNPHKDFRGGGW